MKQRISALALATVLATGSAHAADLPSRKAPVAYVPPPAFSWTGLYGGLNAGYGFGQRSDFNGFVGGGQVGFNYQLTPLLVAGLETDFQGADISTRNGGFNVGFFGARPTKVEWFGTVRGRAGIALFNSQLFVYGGGGFAYGRVKQAGLFNEYSNTQTGWTAGGGVEWAPAAFPRWSAKVEYLYTSLRNNSGSAFFGGNLGDTRFHTVRAGVNYHFNLFAPAPILARF